MSSAIEMTVLEWMASQKRGRMELTYRSEEHEWVMTLRPHCPKATPQYLAVGIAATPEEAARRCWDAIQCGTGMKQTIAQMYRQPERIRFVREHEHQEVLTDAQPDRQLRDPLRWAAVGCADGTCVARAGD